MRRFARPLLLSGAVAVALLMLGPGALVPVGALPSSLFGTASHTVGDVTPSPNGSSLPSPTAPSRPLSPSPVRSPHRGTLEVYEVAPGGATTEDPAVAYDTVSEEPILNVYEPLIAYNGSSGTTFVPVLATCVPGTPQCLSDYGSTLIYQASGQQYTGASGAPLYWTFAIDGNARFYDPSTGKSWGVYPTDVMFSQAREMAWSEAIGVGSTPGWLTAQALLPNGNRTWDDGLHAPYNTTPGDILGSMLINDTSYCPAAAISNEHGCITFVENGHGIDWPQTLQLLSDGLVGAVVPCGWFTYEDAGIPGWAGTAAAHGDGPCKVPQLGHSRSTSSAAWASYIGNLTSPLNTNPSTDLTSWDSFELSIAEGYPAPQPKVEWSMVGSGPYYAQIDPTASPPGYSLAANPAYAEPSGCSGVGGLATYDTPGAYCDPAPGTYEASVHVAYEPDDGPVLGELREGQADFGNVQTTDIATMLQLAEEGKLDYYLSPQLGEDFLPFNLNYSLAVYRASTFPGTPNIPADFFSGSAARALLAEAYPYSEAIQNGFTFDGLPFLTASGGPILAGNAQFYPTNVSFPNGSPETDPSVVGGAAWWWAQGTNPASAYFDPELARCTAAAPCSFPIVGAAGDPGPDTAISEWTSEIEAITGGALEPFTFDLLFDAPYPIPLQLSSYPGEGPLPVYAGNWYADNFDPQDMMLPLAFPNTTFTYPDAVEQQLAQPAYDQRAACGHAANASFVNLAYWARQPQLTSACEGVAFGVANYWDQLATGVSDLPQRVLDYNLVEHILNALNLYVWQGEPNWLTVTAPWISPGSVNLNPVIGGVGDQYWFQVRYVAPEPTVEFREVGLPSGAAWEVTAAGTLRDNLTEPAGRSSSGTIDFSEPNGTLSFSVTAPAGFGVARISGPGSPSYTSANVSGSLTLTVHFGALESVTFAEAPPRPPNWVGLPPDTSWSIVMTPKGTGGPPGQTGTNLTTGGPSSTGSVVFELPAGAHYRWHVEKPADERVSGPMRGTVSVPSHAFAKLLRFGLLGSKVEFTEHGLPAHTPWSVDLSGPVSAIASGSGRTIWVDLPNGTYTYTVPSVATDVGTGTPASPITVAAPSPVRVTVVFGPSGALYPVTFEYPGFSPGMSVNWWEVKVGSQVQQTFTADELTFYEPSGSYTYVFTESLDGTLVVSFSGAFEVQGNATAIQVP